MMTKDKAERLVKIHQEMAELLEEFKRICRFGMEKSEYEQFKYRTLDHIEPAVNEEDTEWFTKYSSIDSLETVAHKQLGQNEADEEII